MLIVGLTGSIGMGKSTIAELFRQRGIAVFDADAVVHHLYEKDAVEALEAAFPGSTSEGRVDRQKLSQHLTRDPNGYRRLEAIVHPLVRARQADFLRQQNDAGSEFAVLEIPLLFETGGDQRVDVVIVVSATSDTQTKRVLERPAMTKEKLAEILARQVPDAEKRARCDFIVDTDQSLEACAGQIDDILSKLSHTTGDSFERHWR